MDQIKFPQEGLTSAEAAKRLERDGFNELPAVRPRRLWSIAFEVVREPMFLMLIAASAIYLVLGDRQEAMVLFASVFVVVGITFYQERKSERALEALREFSSPRALVLRDGRWRRIPGREVVAGDLIRLTEGDRIPADAELIECANLAADESLLTGESMPVRKCSALSAGPSRRPGGDDLPIVFSGTVVTPGQGMARIRATRLDTELGKIGKSLIGVIPDPIALQAETRRAIRNGERTDAFRPDWNQAFHRRADEILSLPRDRPTARTRVHSYPLAPGQPSLAHVWQAEGEAICVVAAALFVEPVSELFRFVAPTLAQLAAAAVAGFSGLAAIELVTRLLPRTQRATAQIG